MVTSRSDRFGAGRHLAIRHSISDRRQPGPRGRGLSAASAPEAELRALAEIHFVGSQEVQELLAEMPSLIRKLRRRPS